MRWCVFRVDSLFGTVPCGHDGVVFDRVRKGYLCRMHAQERYCEFCQAEQARRRVCYEYEGVARDAWVCQRLWR